MQRDFLQLSFGRTLIERSEKVEGWASGLGSGLRTGDQTNGASVVMQLTAALELGLAPLGIKIKWSEFTADPTMLEATNTGGIGIRSIQHSRPIGAHASGFMAGMAAWTPGL